MRHSVLVGNSHEQWRQRDEQRRAAMKRLPVLEVRHHADLAGEPGDVLVTASIGPHGNAMTVWAATDDVPALTSSTTQPTGPTFPDARASRPASARVRVHAPEPTPVASLQDLPLAHITVQPLPQDRILIVGARARWRPEGPDRNAIVYDAEGGVVLAETLGDGIEHVFTTSTGQVWVGYFDEGVYGNYGWGGALSGPTPVGAAGLLRFSQDLQVDWEFPPDDKHPWGAISDCYALNVDGEASWASYYDAFPIVNVKDDAVSGWRNDISCPKALAVSGRRIALVGGYGADRDRLVVGDLEDESFHATGEYRVVLPNEQPIPADMRVIGRGPDLHIFAGSHWHRLDLEDIP